MSNKRFFKQCISSQLEKGKKREEKKQLRPPLIGEQTEQELKTASSNLI